MLQPCDSHVLARTGHAEAPHHAHGCDLPGQSVRHRGADQGIQRRGSQFAGGNSASFKSDQRQVVILKYAGQTLFFSFLCSRWNITTLCRRRGAQSARCPLASSTLKPVLVAASSILLDQRWKSQAHLIPRWTVFTAMTPSRTSGAAWWQSLACSSMPHLSRQCQLITHCTYVTSPLIRLGHQLSTNG